MAAVLMAAALYALHQDFWFWREARPLVFGVLPIGLFDHAASTVATSALMIVLVRSSWPAHLEDRSPDCSRPSVPGFASLLTTYRRHGYSPLSTYRRV